MLLDGGSHASLEYGWNNSNKPITVGLDPDVAEHDLYEYYQNNGGKSFQLLSDGTFDGFGERGVRSALDAFVLP